jgi:asparagine synthase/glutamine amidotransferase-like protein
VGGLIGVFGVPGAADLARSAGAPLVRRSFHKLELAPISQTVCLGFAGERGGLATDPDSGVVLVIDGELFTDGGPVGGRAAASLLLREFVGDRLADPPQGRYAAAVWDPRRETMTVLTDRYRRRPVYRARLRGGHVFAGELKALVAAGVQPRVDAQAWAELLAFEHLLGDRTPLEGVERLPAAATLTIPLHGAEELVRRWRYRLDPVDDVGEGEFVEGFATRLERAVRRRHDGRTGLALSGGLDSRCIAAMLIPLAPDTVALTYGAPGSHDLRLGTAVAARTPFRHRESPFPVGYIAKGAAETVWLSEGHIRSFHSHHLALRALRRDGVRSVFISYGGDHAVRTVEGPATTGDGLRPDLFHEYRAACLTDALLERLLTPSFADTLRGRARESMFSQLDAEVGTDLHRVRQLLFDTQSLKIWPGAELFADDLAPRDPYDDHELVDFLRHMPERFRQGERVQRAFLSAVPRLGDVPTTRDRLAPSVDGTRRRLALGALRAKRELRGAADRMLGPAWWPNRDGLGDYAADLRRGGAELLEILLEPRTIARGQLRPESVRALVSETLNGRARNTRVLGMLLTFELFQRQFIDGEGLSTLRPHAGRQEAVLAGVGAGGENIDPRAGALVKP